MSASVRKPQNPTPAGIQMFICICMRIFHVALLEQDRCREHLDRDISRGKQKWLRVERAGGRGHLGAHLARPGWGQSANRARCQIDRFIYNAKGAREKFKDWKTAPFCLPMSNLYFHVICLAGRSSAPNFNEAYIKTAGLGRKRDEIAMIMTVSNYQLVKITKI